MNAVLIGMRLAVAGGRTGWARLALTALGVGVHPGHRAGLDVVAGRQRPLRG
ncbi:hypothetical protein [Nonomuraea sp. 10N515B]|uniref:hypothetical protein n=1 Tax=Nonomuraea sp. 10N515B TaxID=3457422 RepID=UPI003FCCA755